MKFQVYANGKKYRQPFATRNNAEANAIFWGLFAPEVKFTVKEVKE